MNIFKRNPEFGTQKSFTTAAVQEPIDQETVLNRDLVRSIDWLRSVQEHRPALIRTRTEVGGVFSLPRIWIDSDGKVTNEKLDHMSIEMAPPFNKPWNLAWPSGSANVADLMPRSKCIIQSIEGGVHAGNFMIAVKDIYGDIVSGNICITILRGDYTSIGCDADEDSKQILPDGTEFFLHWYLYFPDGDVITPKALMLVLNETTTTNFSVYFDVAYVAKTETTDLNILTTEKNFGFIKHSLTLSLNKITLDALYVKLAHIFDDNFLQTAIATTRLLNIVLPSEENLDGSITDMSRYMLGTGKIDVSSDMLKYEYELEGNLNGVAVGSPNVIQFAARVDVNTVVFCDGTKIYRDRLTPNFLFASELTTKKRIFYLTGSAGGVFEPSTLSYTDGLAKADLAVWSALDYGYCKGPTKLHSSTSAWVNKYIYKIDAEVLTYFSHKDPLLPVPIQKPLFSVDRWKGYVSIGGGKNTLRLDPFATPEIFYTPPRSFDDVKIPASGTQSEIYPWNHSMLSIVAPDPGASTKAGILFSRAFITLSNKEDNKHVSYLFQSFNTDNTDVVNVLDGLYLVTRSRKLVLGAAPEDYNTADLDDGAAWRSRIIISGGDPRGTVSAYEFSGAVHSRVRTGTTFQNGASKPQCYNTTYGNVINRDVDGSIVASSTAASTPSEEILSYMRTSYLGGLGSEDFDVPDKDHMNIMAWTRLNKPEESVMKFTHKYGTNGPASDAGYPSRDLPGDTGLLVKSRYVGAYHGESLTLHSAELIAYSELNTGTGPGVTGYIPKSIVGIEVGGAVASLETAVSFIGLTKDDSTENIFDGSGFYSVNHPIEGYETRMFQGSNNYIDMTDLRIYLKATDLELRSDSNILFKSTGAGDMTTLAENILLTADKDLVLVADNDLTGVGDIILDSNNYVTVTGKQAINLTSDKILGLIGTTGINMSSPDTVSITGGTNPGKKVMLSSARFIQLASAGILQVQSVGSLELNSTAYVLLTSAGHIDIKPTGTLENSKLTFYGKTAAGIIDSNITVNLTPPGGPAFELVLTKINVALGGGGDKDIWVFTV